MIEDLSDMKDVYKIVYGLLKLWSPALYHMIEEEDTSLLWPHEVEIKTHNLLINSGYSYTNNE